VPAVETGIALSIIYVAIVAIVPVMQQKRGEWAVVGVTGLIGLLHGAEYQTNYKQNVIETFENMDYTFPDKRHYRI